jgi:hypothetical protein
MAIDLGFTRSRGAAQSSSDLMPLPEPSPDIEIVLLAGFAMFAAVLIVLQGRTGCSFFAPISLLV